jgi:hypothetical protein
MGGWEANLSPVGPFSLCIVWVTQAVACREPTNGWDIQTFALWPLSMCLASFSASLDLLQHGSLEIISERQAPERP